MPPFYNPVEVKNDRLNNETANLEFLTVHESRCMVDTYQPKRTNAEGILDPPSPSVSVPQVNNDQRVIGAPAQLFT